MSKNTNKLNPYELSGEFRIIVVSGHIFAGRIKGAWDDALLVEDKRNGDCIIPMAAIAVMMEGIKPPEPTADKTEHTE